MAGGQGAESIAERIRSVREAHGLTQLQFLAVLNRQAAALGAREYTQSTLSKLETGTQEASFTDVAVFAATDRLRRGKLWIAWGETEDVSMARPTSAGVLSQLRVAENRPASELVETPKPRRKGKRAS